jgi:metal-responsive CopG/Arc/MetJ family transcriptional regulator
LGKNRKETIAFPIAFLRTLQRVIKKDSFLKEGDLIKNALRDYIQYLDALEITESCICVPSLELENLRVFLTNRDNLLASAGQ